MYYILSLLGGLLIAVMVLFNGSLTAQYGLHFSVVFIHITGLLLVSIITLIKRQRPFEKRQPWHLYLGGAIGVMTVAFNNFAFGRISVSAILALTLLGQSVFGLAFDQYGWFGMQKHPFGKHKIAGLLLTICGIAVMIDRFDFFPVVLSFAAGGTIVLSRTLNAKLGEQTSVGISTFYNYLLGLIVSTIIFLLFGGNEAIHSGIVISADPLIYTGGFLGVILIMVSNIVVTKVSAFYLSLMMFIGQVLTGIIIDALLAGSFSITILIGGILVSAGLCVDLILSRAKNRKLRK